MSERRETATLAAGCFWCVEAVFSRLSGVKKVIAGYAGGKVPAPSYQEVCSGTTGHAESVQILFDPEEISFAQILEVFWQTHNPTTQSRQGADVGPQYRSVIFYHDEVQRSIAEQSRRDAEAKGSWPDPVVTEIAPFTNFYAAEDYHQGYYRLNPDQPYCRLIIAPKLRELLRNFAGMLKEPERT